MCQSVLYGGHTVPEELLWKDCPADKKGDYDYLMEVIDWEENVTPDFHKKRFMAPLPVAGADMERDGCFEEWICYKNPAVSSKRLTIRPGAEVAVKDAAPYGIICLQGRGEINGLPLESPTLIRYGQETYDEYFITAEAACNGVVYKNTSKEDIVVLKHFALNPDLDKILT